MSDHWIENEKVNQGGLMRCCLQSLGNQLHAMTEPPDDGTVLDCEYETSGNGSLIRDGGSWRWNKEGVGASQA